MDAYIVLVCNSDVFWPADQGLKLAPSELEYVEKSYGCALRCQDGCVHWYGYVLRVSEKIQAPLFHFMVMMA